MSVVIDPVLQDLPAVKDTSGVRNFTYVAPVKNFERDIAAFRRIVPFSNLAIVVDRGIVEALPQLGLLARVSADKFGYTFSIVPAEDTVDDVLRLLPDDVDAVFITPLARFTETHLQALALGLRSRQLPSFSLWGRQEVELGILASMAADDDGVRLARRVALNVQRILLGEDPAGFRVSISQRERLTVNMKTMRAIGASPSWDVLTEALKLHEVDESIERLTLREAIDIALGSNLSLVVRRYDVDIAADELSLSRSRYRPQIGIGAQALLIDDDRAEASFGQQPERTTTAQLTIDQLIYADAADGEIDVRSHQLAAAESDLSGIELDTVLQAATAYLDVLIARSAETIQIENLETTRTNLDLAQTRETIGVSESTEVIRWEREIADDLKSLAEARSRRRRAEAQLNQVLHRQLDAETALEDVSVANADLLATDQRVLARVDSPFDLQVFSRFMVEEGLRQSVEIAGLDAAIAAQQRLLVSARRSRWPTIGAQLGISNRVSESGAGANLPSAADDTDWNLSLNLNLPLYEGGSIGVEVERTQREFDDEHFAAASRLRRDTGGARADRVQRGQARRGRCRNHSPSTRATGLLCRRRAGASVFGRRQAGD